MKDVAFRVVGGMLRIIFGAVLNAIGIRSAGSGPVIDRVQRRRGLEPYGRVEGGTLSDKLDEAGIGLGRIGVAAAAPSGS